MSQNKEYFFGQQFSDISLLKEALMEELIFYILNKNNFETYALNSEKWGNDTTFCLSAFKERVTDKFASLVYRTNWLMDTMEEAWQILGLSYIESGDRRILYINELSDFALYSKMRYPLRADHWGISNLGDTPEELFVTYKFNPEVYDALLRIHASSLEQYSLRLMYPQGRLSFEYFLLNRHIASQYTEVLKTKIEQDRREISLNMDKN